MWELSVPWQELVARSALVYALFLFVLQISGKRELGQFTIFDHVEAALREHGLGSIAEVRHAVLERDGSISVVPREGSRLRISARHRHYPQGRSAGSVNEAATA